MKTALFRCQKCGAVAEGKVSPLTLPPGWKMNADGTLLCGKHEE